MSLVARNDFQKPPSFKNPAHCKTLVPVITLCMIVGGLTACAGGGGSPSTIPPTVSSVSNNSPMPLPQLGGTFDNATVATLALNAGPHNDTFMYQDGTAYVGECKQFVNDMLNKASGGLVPLGFNYYSQYRSYGGIEVSSGNAVGGDVIQINYPSDKDNYHNGMHTAIIVSNNGNNSFDVIDSNFHLTHKLLEHTWDPFAYASGKGLEVHIWRMGQTSTPAPPGPTPSPSGNPPPTSPSDGTIQTMNPPSASDPPLRIHTGPHLSDPMVGSLPAGTKVSINCQTHSDMFSNGNWGPTDVWDYVIAGNVSGYATDGLIYTGSNQPVSYDCFPSHGH